MPGGSSALSDTQLPQTSRARLRECGSSNALQAEQLACSCCYSIAAVTAAAATSATGAGLQLHQCAPEMVA